MPLPHDIAGGEAGLISLTDHHQIKTRRKKRGGLLESRPDDTLQAVSTHSVAHFACHCDPESGRRLAGIYWALAEVEGGRGVGVQRHSSRDHKHKMGRRNSTPLSSDSLELGSFADAS